MSSSQAQLTLRRCGPFIFRKVVRTSLGLADRRCVGFGKHKLLEPGRGGCWWAVQSDHDPRQAALETSVSRFELCKMILKNEMPLKPLFHTDML